MSGNKPVLVVFDTESEPPVPLGVFTRVIEDAVLYTDPEGTLKRAPEDCVSIVSVSREQISLYRNADSVTGTDPTPPSFSGWLDSNENSQTL